MFIRPITISQPVRIQRNTIYHAPKSLSFTSRDYAFMSDEQLKNTLVEKYKDSPKSEDELLKDITEDVLLNKYDWNTSKQMDNDPIMDEVLMNVISVGMYSVMKGIKKGSDMCEAEDIAKSVVDIISYLKTAE